MFGNLGTSEIILLTIIIIIVVIVIKIRKKTKKLTSREFNEGSDNICSRCNGAGWIEKTSLGPLAKYSGSAGRQKCPRCKGQGTLEK
jgi:DnaJ-class molecular chaperone